MELLVGVLVATTAFGLERFLRRPGTGVEVDRGFSFQAGRVTVALTTVVSSGGGRRTGVTAPVRLLDGRGGATVGSTDRRRVPNLALADDSLLYVVIPDVGPLRTPFWVGTICRGFEVTGFWRVILSAPQYEKLILLFRSESSESPASSSSSSSGSGMIRGCTEACNVLERTTLSQYESKRPGTGRKWNNALVHRDNTFTWLDNVANVPGLDL